jgi:hypothetical protein
MRTPKRTMARKLALLALARQKMTHEQLTVLLYDENRWDTRSSTLGVINGLLKYNLAVWQKNGMIRITPQGRAFINGK